MEEGYVSVEIELDNDLLLQLALMAHRKDITLNQLIIDILKKEVERLEPVNAVFDGNQTVILSETSETPYRSNCSVRNG